MYFFVCFAALLVACNAQAQPGNTVKSSVCTQRNSYLPVNGNCDSYIECVEYTATNMQCPDGLHFDPSAQWPTYPCGYPQDVSCQGRSILQPAKSTPDCPNQYGFFPSPLAAANDCSHYRMCVDGHATEMYCPSGLAFNPDTARCDWPENVPKCPANDYIGYTCPAATIDENGFSIVTNHKFEGDCFTFYACVDGHARLLSCDPGFAFDDNLGRCVNSDQVACGANNMPNNSQ